MSLFHEVARTISTSVEDYVEDEKVWLVVISAKIDGLPIDIDFKLDNIDDVFLARVEAWFCHYLMEQFYGSGRSEDHADVAKGNWKDGAKRLGLLDARLHAKSGRRGGYTSH